MAKNNHSAAPASGAPEPGGEQGPGGPPPRRLKRTRTTGDLEKLKKKVWQSISAAEEILLDEHTDNATRLRAIHALIQASTAYTRLVEFDESAQRVAELEARVAAVVDDAE